MANQVIAPVIPNLSAQIEAVAASQGVVFTATDRKVIEERGGTTDPRGSFIDALAKRPLNAKVENEETTVKPEPDVKELEARYRDHRRILKFSNIYVPHEHVEITNTPPDTVTTAPQPPAATVKPQTAPAKNDLKEKTISIAKELKLDPAEVFDKFSLEQQELYGLICRIKELHFKRLLSENQAEFETLSSTIQTETLNVSKPAAKNWVVEQLNKLTIDSVNYKIRLLESLQRLDFNAKRKVTLHWLNRLAGRLSKNAQ